MPTKVLIRFKGCPRCGGDQAYEKDRYGAVWDCLQCGHQEFCEKEEKVGGKR